MLRNRARRRKFRKRNFLIKNMTYSCPVWFDKICEKGDQMKIDRLIGILSILLQKEMTTAPELADHFEVSRRTINRDIEALCKAGIPIQTSQGAGGGISIMNGYRMDRTLLTSRDMQMILAGLRSLDSVSGSRYYGQLMEKIQAGSSEFVNGRNSILIDLSSWYQDTLPPKIGLIQDAIELRRRIRFDYYSPGGETKREIEPYYLIFKWSSWYAYGFCLLREDFRLFKLNRMDSIVHTSDKFHLINNVNTSVRDLIAREVIGNILVHRDYSSAYPAKVIIEKDWLKTENWCIPRRHGNIMQDEFQPYPKNPIIQRFFANIGRTDTIGSGVINLYKYTPIFSDGGKPELFEDDVFKITIPLNKEAAKEASDQKKLSDREQAIYNLICENKHLTVEQVMAEFDISRATVFRDYAKIKKITGAVYDKNESVWKL